MYRTSETRYTRTKKDSKYRIQEQEKYEKKLKDTMFFIYKFLEEKNKGLDDEDCKNDRTLCLGEFRCWIDKQITLTLK